MSDDQTIDLSIIIVSWNVIDMLMDCLDSILDNSIVMSRSKKDQINFEVILVDSASSDHTVDVVKRQFPQVKLFAQSENIGFTKGNNIGLEQARGRHILLLNPDTLVLGNALQVMVDYMDANPDVGIIGPYTLNTDGTYQSTRRRFPTPKIGFFESTCLQPYAPQSMLDYYYVNDVAELSTVDVDWVQGSALMLRRAVYEQLGGLDSGFVMYSEELDFCKRVKNAGWRVVFLCTSQIIHHGGKSSEQSGAQKHVHFQRSKLRYFRKYHGFIVARSMQLFLISNYLVQIGIETGKLLAANQVAMRRKRISTYFKVLFSGLKVTR